MKELKPCPFCGGKALIQSESRVYGDNHVSTGLFVECVSCGAGTRLYTLASLATEAWNKRK